MAAGAINGVAVRLLGYRQPMRSQLSPSRLGFQATGMQRPRRPKARAPAPGRGPAVVAATRPDLLIQQSCPRGLKYVRNPWLDYMVDELRKLDTRWGYNAKPNRTAADNEGVPVEVAGDEITYHFGPGRDEGATDVYPIDILLGHCGSSPSVTFRVFTGEEFAHAAHLLGSKYPILHGFLIPLGHRLTGHVTTHVELRPVEG